MAKPGEEKTPLQKAIEAKNKREDMLMKRLEETPDILKKLNEATTPEEEYAAKEEARGILPKTVGKLEKAEQAVREAKAQVETERGAAATKIQSAFRGSKVRRETIAKEASARLETAMKRDVRLVGKRGASLERDIDNAQDEKGIKAAVEKSKILKNDVKVDFDEKNTKHQRKSAEIA